MDERDVLAEGFEYDFWATSAWLAAVPKMPDPTRSLEVLEHMAWAHNRWLERVGPEYSVPQGALEERFKGFHDAWVSIAKSKDLRKVLAYRILSGEAMSTEVGAICRHVIDHGTYHRGQLRGLAEMQSWPDFPDVGLIGFYREFKLHE